VKLFERLVEILAKGVAFGAQLGEPWIRRTRTGSTPSPASDPIK